VNCTDSSDERPQKVKRSDLPAPTLPCGTVVTSRPSRLIPITLCSSAVLDVLFVAITSKQPDRLLGLIAKGSDRIKLAVSGCLITGLPTVGVALLVGLTYGCTIFGCCIRGGAEY